MEVVKQADSFVFCNPFFRIYFQCWMKATIQGDELRVSSKSRDDLQSVISLLKGADLDIDLQFVNYR